MFFGIFATICGRLIQLGATLPNVDRALSPMTASRPDILDRNGEAGDRHQSASLFAEPRRIVDVDEAIAEARTVLRPRLDDELADHKRRTGAKGFVWLKRQLTPPAATDLIQLGIPGIDFLTESALLPVGETRPTSSGDQHRQPRHLRHRKTWRRQRLSDLQSSGLPAATRSCRSTCRSTCASSTWCASRLTDGWSATRGGRAGAVDAQRQDRRSPGDGLGAGFRSEQPLQRGEERPAEPHHRRPLRDGLDLQDRHLGRGA